MTGQHNRKMFQARCAEILSILKTTPLTAYQIATRLNMSHSSALNYIKAFKKKKQVHIIYYRINEHKRNVAYYAAGNCKDAKPEKYVKEEFPKNYKFTPRCDVAAQWLRNPL